MMPINRALYIPFLFLSAISGAAFGIGDSGGCNGCSTHVDASIYGILVRHGFVAFMFGVVVFILFSVLASREVKYSRFYSCMARLSFVLTILFCLQVPISIAVLLIIFASFGVGILVFIFLAIMLFVWVFKPLFGNIHSIDARTHVQKIFDAIEKDDVFELDRLLDQQFVDDAVDSHGNNLMAAVNARRDYLIDAEMHKQLIRNQRVRQRLIERGIG